MHERFNHHPQKGEIIDVAMPTHDGRIWVPCEVQHSTPLCFDVRFPGGQHREFWKGDEGWRRRD